jgi:NAD(P)-dependent dehydrogenase (short-subunit alcohol dehydrogenase family)
LGEAVTVTPEDLKVLMDVNLGTALWLSQAVEPYMRQRGKGSIVHVSARPGTDPTAGLAAYSLSKAALSYLIRILDVELRPHGIRVNAVAPQLIDTAANRATFPAEADALIWSSPTYHGSVSGSFKNALDWLILLAENDPPYLSNKPIGLVTTAGGVQGLQAVNTMDFIARSLRGWSVPLVLPVAQSWQSFDPDGHLKDEAVATQLRKLGAEVVRAARQFQAHGTCDYAEGTGIGPDVADAAGRPG